MNDFLFLFYKPNSICREKKYSRIAGLIFFSLVLLAVFTFARMLLLKNFEVQLKSGYLEFIIINAIIFGPLKEENLFRLFLVFSKRNFVLFLITILIALIGFVDKNYRIYLDSLLLIITFFLYSKLDKDEYVILNKLKVGLIIFFSFLFWVFHILIFEKQGVNELIIISPIFLMGFVLSYIRLKTNLYVSLITHSVFNLLAIIVL